MPAKYVRPYSKDQKNDYRDAEAIAEAVQRPTMKFVATKTADQLDLQAPHRVRERFVGQRTTSSIRSAPSCWSAESRCGKGCGSCAPSCPASLRREAMRSHPACCASSKTCRRTSAAWTRALRASPARSKRWLVKTKAASD